MAALKAKTLELASRSVHIKMHPTPRSLPERREVLRVLERFGELTMFRSYKYHPLTPIPDAFLSMFASPSSAKEAQAASPIRYRLISSPSESDPSSVERTAGPDSNTTSTPSSSPPEEREFELHITASEFDHIHHITSPHTNPLHGPFTPIQTRRSFISHSLAQTIPESIWSRGLRDWETDIARRKQQRDYEGREGREDGSGSGSKGKGDGPEGAGTQVYKRTLVAREKRRREKEIPAIMKGLRGLRRDAESSESGRSSAESLAEGTADVGFRGEDTQSQSGTAKEKGIH